ncbi:MAG: lipoate protein ligase C-terminal domain-containing protein, partial [Saezia sp.]
VLSERFLWGGVDLNLNVEGGVVTEAQIFTDSLQPAALESLALKLQGCHYDAIALGECCETVFKDFPQVQSEMSELTQWLVRELS